MKRGAVRGWEAAALAAVAALAVGAGGAAGVAGCAYAPNPQSGALSCGPSNSCPEGFACEQGKCWSDDDVTARRLLGTWTFAQGSTRSVTCSDNTTDTASPVGTTIEVLQGVSSDLIATYFCSFNLNVSGNKASLTDDLQKCPYMTADLAYTMHGKTFNLTTSDGKNATMSASMEAQLVVGTGSCNLNFAGPLTK